MELDNNDNVVLPVEWRPVAGDERVAVDQFMTQALIAYRNRMILIGLIVEFCVVIFSIGVGLTYVEGEPSTWSGICFGLVCTAMNVAACAFFYKGRAKLKTLADECKYLVTEINITDKRTHSTRNGTTYYVTFTFGNGEKCEVRTFSSNYEKVSLASRAITMKYNNDDYSEGVFDEYDVVIVE
ncbi:MAG: hypothetical protein MJ108_00940 [Saccharofermentans sp.]|nr:hypothetical protein [Saccharofermentans sp.]